MEYVLAAVAIASMVLNCVLVRRLTKTPLIEYVPCEILETAVAKDSEEVPVITIEDPRTDSVTKKEQPSFQAWTNRRNIPWSDLDRPRQAPARAITRGPLERPPGFPL